MKNVYECRLLQSGAFRVKLGYFAMGSIRYKTLYERNFKTEISYLSCNDDAGCILDKLLWINYTEQQ